jgi:hypothetical protein
MVLAVSVWVDSALIAAPSVALAEATRRPRYQVLFTQPTLAPEQVLVIKPFASVSVYVSPLTPGPTACAVSV